ncbi:MAG: hypothetical protein NC102_00030 [Clostridium sp.]|nr:hypothetical protein [Clostridium sp.]
MKTLRYICACLSCMLMALPFSACSDDPADLYAEVEMILATDASDHIQIVRPDNGQPTTFLTDINNKRVYEIPTFIDNRATVRVEKGVYVMAFDADAVMPNGVVKRVRMLGHSVMHDALTFDKARQTVTLKIIFL